MKIEKVNDNQIRCTLTKEDLAGRSLKISELAYGTQKAKDLFRDMMQQASFEFGFEAEDIPLMIEAIPFSEYVVLIITKVEDPEELDTRFSKFAPSNEEDDEEEFLDEDEDAALNVIDEKTQNVLDLFKRIKDSCDEVLSHSPQDAVPSAIPSASKVPNIASDKSKVQGLVQAFCFESINELIKTSQLIGDKFAGPSSVYRDEVKDEYLLLIKQGEHTVEEFAKVCNLLSEYATLFRAMTNVESYFEEHFTPVSIGSAITVLSKI